MKTYPLQPEYLYEQDSGLRWIASKGHHGAEAFLAAVLAWDPDLARAEIGAVTHEYRRSVYDIFELDGSRWWQETGPGRGAFPVTIADYVRRRE